MGNFFGTRGVANRMGRFRSRQFRKRSTLVAVTIVYEMERLQLTGKVDFHFANFDGTRGEVI